MKQDLDIEAEKEYDAKSAEALDFTQRSEDVFYNTVDLADFRNQDAEAIYRCLIKEIRPIPFCDHLKYLYENPV